MLPAGYTLRAAHLDDAHAAADLINASEMVDLGAPNTSAHSLRRIWRSPDHNAEDSQLVVAPNGNLAAVLNRFPEGAHLVEFDGYVLPAERGRGIGSALLDLVERDARAHAQVASTDTIRLTSTAWGVNRGARALLERRGYTLVRRWERMLIEMSAPPPAPEPPVGVTLRTFAPGQDDQPFAEAMEAAQADERGRLPLTWQQWRYYHIESVPDFDPTLCFVAEERGQIIGGAICSWERPRDPDVGFVRDLAVRPLWRPRDVGLALAQAIFATFYARGKRQVGVGVDPDSPASASAVYQRAGMHVVSETDVYEKIVPLAP